MSAEELEQTAAHSEDSLDEASLEVDPETPSTKNRKYVKVGIAVAAFAAIGLGIGIGFETGKDGNAQSNSSMSAFMNGWSGSDGSYKCDDEHAYGYGGKSGKTKGGYGDSGMDYSETFVSVGEGFCEGSEFIVPLLYEGLIFNFETPSAGSLELCKSACSGVAGPGFRGFNYVMDEALIDCVCYFDDGLVPDCPRNDFLSHSGWSSEAPSPVSFVCAKSELGIAAGPIEDAVPLFGIKTECYRSVNSYGGKSGKSKGSGYSGHSGYHGKSGKGYHESGLSFVDEGFCRDTEDNNYDAVWFVVAGLVETPHDGNAPLLGLCEAKCNSPPSYNPDIEHFAATGLVGVNYNTLFAVPFSSMTAGDNMSLLSESVSESISLPLAEELGEGFILSADITQAVEEQLDVFVDAMTAEGGRRLTSGSTGLEVAACFCDYTDDAISCEPEDDINGVFAISGGDVSSSPFTTVDLNLSGPMPYVSVSAACFDKLGGEGPVSGTSGSSKLGFDCYRNNWSPFHSHGGAHSICHAPPLSWLGSSKPVGIPVIDSLIMPMPTPTTDLIINTPRPTPLPTAGSTPTVSDETTGPPTREGRSSVEEWV